MAVALNVEQLGVTEAASIYTEGNEKWRRGEVRSGQKAFRKLTSESSRAKPQPQTSLVHSENDFSDAEIITAFSNFKSLFLHKVFGVRRPKL